MNGLKAACWAACHGRGAGAVPRQDCVASRGRRRVQRGLLQKNSRQSGNNKHLFVSDSLSTSSKTLCCVRIILCRKTIYNPRARPIAPHLQCAVVRRATAAAATAVSQSYGLQGTLWASAQQNNKQLQPIRKLRFQYQII